MFHQEINDNFVEILQSIEFKVVFHAPIQFSPNVVNFDFLHVLLISYLDIFASKAEFFSENKFGNLWEFICFLIASSFVKTKVRMKVVFYDFFANK